MQLFEEFSRALGTAEKVANNEQRPLIADQLERAGDWTTINFASSHLIIPAFATELTTNYGSTILQIHFLKSRVVCRRIRAVRKD